VYVRIIDMNTPPARAAADYYLPAASSDSDFSRTRRKKHLEESTSPPSLRAFEELPEGYLSSRDVDRQRRLDQERSLRKEIDKTVRSLEESDWLLAVSGGYRHHYPQL